MLSATISTVIRLLPKYRNDRDGYTEAKSEFVKGIIRETKVMKKVVDAELMS